MLVSVTICTIATYSPYPPLGAQQGVMDDAQKPYGVVEQQ